MDTVDWRLRRLSTDKASRHACLRALLQDGYDHVDTMLLRKNLFDVPSGHKSVTVRLNESGTALETSVQGVHRIASNYLALANRLWTIWNDPHNTEFQRIFRSRVRCSCSMLDQLPCFL